MSAGHGVGLLFCSSSLEFLFELSGHAAFAFEKQELEQQLQACCGMSQRADERTVHRPTNCASDFSA